MRAVATCGPPGYYRLHTITKRKHFCW